MRRVPKDRRPDAKPLRLGAREEVHPYRLVSPIRRMEQSAVVPSPPAAERWDGAALRAAREAAGVDLDALARRTRLPRATLDDLETMRVETLPRAYLVGFLSTVAKELRLDPKQVTRSYLDALHPPPPAPEGEAP